MMQFPNRLAERLRDIGDPEFEATDPCLHCSLPFDCDESNPECRFQESLPVRTIAIDPIHTMPVALRRQHQKRRQSWKDSNQRSLTQAI